MWASYTAHIAQHSTGHEILAYARDKDRPLVPQMERTLYERLVYLSFPFLGFVSKYHPLRFQVT